MRKTTFLFAVLLLIGTLPVQGQSLENTCWRAIHKNDNTSWVLQFSSGDSLFMTGYDSFGIKNYNKRHFGSYHQSNDTVTFNFLSWHPCNTVSGIYTFTITNNQIFWTLVTDSCPDRSPFFTSTHDHLNCSIGTKEFELNPLSIYPNPAANKIIIEQLGNGFDQYTQIILYDLLGNKLLKEFTSSGENTYTLNVGHLSAGIYILQLVEQNTVMAIERVVIKK